MTADYMAEYYRPTKDEVKSVLANYASGRIVSVSMKTINDKDKDECDHYSVSWNDTEGVERYVLCTCIHVAESIEEILRNGIINGNGNGDYHA